MSWNKSYPSKAAFDANESSSGSFGDDDKPHMADQIELARNVASQVIESGVVGDDTKDFTINLSGHGNPDHAPASGWANDTVTISVTQKSA
jgi:hypothetical protein